MKRATVTFSKLFDALQQHYGCPAPPPSTDPLEIVIWENIAYLASDKRRAQAFATLQQTIGTRPSRKLNKEQSVIVGVRNGSRCRTDAKSETTGYARAHRHAFDSQQRDRLGSTVCCPAP
jgi:hypothetical protein